MTKTILFLISFLLSWIFLSCEKQKDKILDTLNVSGIKNTGSLEIVNVRLESNHVTASPVNCYVMGSTLFDPETKSFGYNGCNSQFIFVDPQTGDTIRSFAIPENLSMIVLDTADNMLIGHCYEEGSNCIYKINIETGDIVARNPIDFGQGVFACSYFYRASEKQYVLIRADSLMISINPDNGNIVHSVKLSSAPENSCFIAEDDLLIGLTYSLVTDQNYIVTLDTKTGGLLNNVQIPERNDYYACISSYDAETGCYILVTADDRILFIDVHTGEIRDSYQTDFQIQEFKFWREQ